MEIKTSKIKEITSIGEPWGQYKIMYHKLIMENGDKLDIGKIEKLTEGSEINYYFTDDVGQQEYTKAKTPSKMEMQRGPAGSYTKNSQKYAQRNEKDTEQIIRQVCIKASCQYHTGRNTTGQDIIEDAKLFEAYITGKDVSQETPF